MKKSKDVNKLQKVRLIKNMTQTEMAHELNLATSTYNMYENNKRKIPLKICKEICSILDIKLEDYFTPESFSIK